MNTQFAQQVASDNPQLTADYQKRMQELLSRSATDTAFRARLVTEPRPAMEEFFGLDCSGVDVRFVENHADATIVLPPFVDENAELSDRELEAVAGGTDPCVGSIIISIVTIIGTGIALYQDGKEDAQKTAQ